MTTPPFHLPIILKFPIICMGFLLCPSNANIENGRDTVLSEAFAGDDFTSPDMPLLLGAAVFFSKAILVAR